MTGFQINGIDLDDLLQPVGITGATLPLPSIDFTNYELNGNSLAGRFAGQIRDWQKKMQRSFLLNGQEINSVEKGYYPTKKSFVNITSVGATVITRYNNKISLTGAQSGDFDISWFTHNGGVIPWIIGVALSGGGGGGGGGNGTQSASGGGGGGMLFVVLDFTVMSSYTLTLGGGGSRTSGGTGSRPRAGTGGTSHISRTVDGVTYYDNAYGGQGGATQGSAVGGGADSNWVHGTRFAHGYQGGGSWNQSVGGAVSWNHNWTATADFAGYDWALVSGSQDGGEHPGSGGGGGSSYGKGGKGGQNSSGSGGTNGGGGGGGAWRIFDGQSGGTGGAGVAWLYY